MIQFDKGCILTEYLTEQEQIELLKNWLKQYSFVIIMGIVVALIAAASMHYWQKRQTKRLTHASAVYDEMLSARGQNNTTDTYIQANKLFKHYTNTSYGTMAALMLARHAVSKKTIS